jgi:hypothetical protein
MAEQDTNKVQETVATGAAVANKPKAATKPKAKAKAKSKTAKKPKAKAKAKSKAAPKKPHKVKGDKGFDIGARKVSSAVDGELNSDQIRQLRALRDAGGKELTRGDLKEAVGIGRDGKYSQAWLDSLWALARKRPPFITISNYEGDRKAYHTITAAGKAALKKAEDAAKKVVKDEAA